jgi:hypothetical protein
MNDYAEVIAGEKVRQRMLVGEPLQAELADTSEDRLHATADCNLDKGDAGHAAR